MSTKVERFVFTYKKTERQLAHEDAIAILSDAVEIDDEYTTHSITKEKGAYKIMSYYPDGSQLYIELRLDQTKSNTWRSEHGEEDK